MSKHDAVQICSDVKHLPWRDPECANFSAGVRQITRDLVGIAS
jgi:hypothetical protein